MKSIRTAKGPYLPLFRRPVKITAPFENAKQVMRTAKPGNYLNMLFSAIAVSETWSNKSKSDLFNIHGYHLISNSREHKLGGGVGLCFPSSNLNFKPKTDLQRSDNSLYESVFVEIMQPHGKHVFVGCYYRPPVSLNDFKSTEDNLSAISFEIKLSYIMGDLNINILNSHSHQPTNEFFNLMTSNCLYPSVCKPTRITSSTATLIDNIFTNNLELNMNSCILCTDLSDYLPVFQVTNLKLVAQPPCQRDSYVSLTPQLCQHSGLNWKMLIGL